MKKTQSNKQGTKTQAVKHGTKETKSLSATAGVSRPGSESTSETTSQSKTTGNTNS